MSPWQVIFLSLHERGEDIFLSIEYFSKVRESDWRRMDVVWL